MKLRELIKDVGGGEENFLTYNEDWGIIEGGKDRDCIVAYEEGEIGTLFIVKGKRKNQFWAFYWLKGVIEGRQSRMPFCKRLNLREVHKRVQNSIIIDKKAMERIPKILMLKELKK